MITGGLSVGEAKNLHKDRKEKFRALSMNLRDWDSNNQEFYNSVPKTDQSS